MDEVVRVKVWAVVGNQARRGYLLATSPLKQRDAKQQRKGFLRCGHTAWRTMTLQVQIWGPGMRLRLNKDQQVCITMQSWLWCGPAYLLLTSLIVLAPVSPVGLSKGLSALSAIYSCKVISTIAFPVLKHFISMTFLGKFQFLGTKF